MSMCTSVVRHEMTQGVIEMYKCEDSNKVSADEHPRGEERIFEKCARCNGVGQTKSWECTGAETIYNQR